MSDTFDPYYKWLGIPPAEQPANHYRMLGLPPFESDLDVIENAADQRMAHVRTFQSGKNGKLSQKLLNELSAVRVCLLNPEKKAAYDAKLKSEMSAGDESNAPENELQVAAPYQPVTPLQPATPAAADKPPITRMPLPQAASLQQPVANAPQPAASKPAGRKPKWILPAAVGGGGILVLIVVVAFVAIVLSRSSDEETAEKGDQPPVKTDPADDRKSSTGDTNQDKTEDSEESSSVSSGTSDFTPPSADELSPYGVEIDERGYVLMPAMLGLDREFTIELWHRSEQANRPKPIVGASGKHPGSSQVASWHLVTLPTSESMRLVFQYQHQGENPIRVQTEVDKGVFGRWHHLAVCKSAAEIKVFVNGEPEIAFELREPSSELQIPQRIGIGADPRQRTHPGINSGGSRLRGLRVSSTARYDAPFTPPATFDADAGTIALLDFSQPEVRLIADVNRKHNAELVGARWVKSDGSPVELAGELPPVEAGNTWESASSSFGAFRKTATGWLHERGGSSSEYVELDRTDEYVELVSSRSPQRFRIYGHELRQWRPSDSSWRKLIPGKWKGSQTPVAESPSGPDSEFAIRLQMGELDSVRLKDTRGLTDSGKPNTVEFWFRLNSPATGNSYIIGDRVLRGQDLNLNGRQLPVGWNFWCTSEGDCCVLNLRSPVRTESDKWTHIALCRTGDETVLYKNGKRSTRFRITWPDGLSDLYLGFSPYFTVRSERAGPVDFAALRVSSAVVYSSDFEVPAKLEKTDETELLLDFSQANSETIADLSGHGRDAEIHGAQWIKLDGTPVTPSTIPSTPEIPETPIAEKKLEVPGKEQQAAALAEIEDLFEEKLRRAKSDDKVKVSLAKELLGIAGDSDVQPVNQFVLLRQAQDLALSAGEIDLAFEVAGQIAGTFEVDRLAGYAKLIEDARTEARATPQREALIRHILEALDWFVDEGRFDLAGKAATTANSLASRASVDKDLRIAARDKRNEVNELKQYWEKAEEAKKALEQDADDAQAHLALGLYECFIRGNWQDGLEHFAKCSSPSLKAAANRDLAQPEDATAQIEAGDAWWDLSKNQDGRIKNSLLLRARKWYNEALPNASAIKKLQLRERLKETEGIAKAEAKEAERFSSAPRQGPDDLRGLVGYATNNNRRLPVIFHYESGGVFYRQPITEWLHRHDTPSDSSSSTVNLQGILTLDKATEVSIYNHAATSSSSYSARVMIDGKLVSQAGGGQPQISNLKQQLSKGSHTVGWLINGSVSYGVCDFRDEDGKRIPVYHDKRLLQQLGAGAVQDRLLLGQAVEMEATAKLIGLFLQARGSVRIAEITATGRQSKSINSVAEITSPYFFIDSMSFQYTSNPHFNDQAVSIFQGSVPIRSLRLQGSRITDQGLASLAGLYMLRSLDLQDSIGITGEGLKSLAALRNLEYLNLEGTAINDETIQYCKQFPILETLRIERTGITEKGVAALREAPSLEQLHVGSPAFRDAAFQALPQLPRLDALYVSNTTVSDQALQSISQCDKLDRLHLEQVRIGSATSFRFLTAAKDLDNLYLRSVQGITPDSFEQIAKIPTLSYLYVYESPAVTDAALARLKDAKQLRNIYFYNTGATAAGADALKKFLPTTNISINGTSR